MIILAIEPLASSQQQNKKEERKRGERKREERKREVGKREGRKREERALGGLRTLKKDNDYASDHSQQSCDTVIISQDEPERDDTIELPNEHDTIEFPPLVRTHAIRRIPFQIKEE